MDRSDRINYPPPLPADEQVALCRRAQAGDVAARNRLIATTMRMVVTQVRSLQSLAAPHVSAQDLVHEAAFGLVRAIEKFDCDRGVRFTTYAGAWIRQAIQTGLHGLNAPPGMVHKKGSGRRGAHERARRVVRHYSARIAAGDAHEQAVEAVARAVGSRPETVGALLDLYRHRRTVSLDAPAFDGDADLTPLVETIAGSGAGADDQIGDARDWSEVRTAIDRVHARLTTRELAIVDRRILAADPCPLRALAEQFGLSRERIRQIEVKLYARLAATLQRLPAARALARAADCDSTPKGSEQPPSPAGSSRRKTHCRHGHPLTGENIWTYNKTGARHCRTCMRQRDRDRRRLERERRARLRTVRAIERLSA